LGLREEGGRPVMAMLSDYLRAKTTLLLLDNCEHLIGACAHWVTWDSLRYTSTIMCEREHCLKNVLFCIVIVSMRMQVASRRM